MKVSIITACYNRAKTIGDTIESVLRQDYPDIEYIVVDGASTDGSQEVIGRYKDKIAKYVSEPDSGMYEALNKGIRMSTGDIIGMAHSDDMLFDSLVVSEVVKKFEKTGADLVYCDGIFVSQNDLDKKVRYWKGGKYNRKKVRMGWLPLHTTVFIKRDVMMRLGLYNEDYKIAADTDLLVRYLKRKDLKVAYLKRTVIRMRMGGLSTNVNTFGNVWKEDIHVYRGHNIHPAWLVKLFKMGWKVPQFVQAIIN